MPGFARFVGISLDYFQIFTDTSKKIMSTTTSKVLHSVLDTLSLLVGETHEYTHNTMSAMSPRSQTMTLYATVLGSALTTTLLLTSTFGRPSSKTKSNENNDDLTLHDLIPKRVRGKAEGGNVVIPSSTRTSALDREIHSLDTSSSPSSLSSLLRSTELMEKEKKKDSIIHASGSSSNTTTTGGDDNDDDYTELSSVVETHSSTEDEVVFEETGTLGTYYIVGETRPTPKQQLENLLDTMTSSSRGTTTVDTRPCPPSFRKREQSNGEEGERNQDSSEDDYRLLSNKAYYPTAMANASNSVTKKWSSVSSSSSSSGSRSNAEYEKSSSLVMPSTHTDRLRHHHVPRGSVTPLGDSSTTTTMLGRQPRVTRSVGKNFPPRRSQLQQHANPLPSPSMNRMRTRDQHLSYGGNPQQTTRAATTTTKRGSSTSSSNNNNNTSSSSSSMAATPSSLHMSTTSTWSSTPSPSLPLGAMSSRPSPSPAAPSPRSGRSTLRPIGRTGSILGVSRGSNGTSSVSAPRASVSLTAQKQQKLLSLSRGVSIKQQQQQQQATSSSTEVRRIKFQMPDSPQHVANDENVVHREISTPPKQDRNNYSSPMKMSVPATSMSPSPPQQSRAVSRTLSYTPAKLPSTANNIVV